MSYPKQLLRLQPQRGFISDTADHEVGPDFWTQCANVQFRDGFATRLQGYRASYTDEVATIAPTSFFHAVNTNFAGLNWWLLFEADGTANAIQAGATQQIDNGLLSAVAKPQEYSSALLNGLPIISNSRDELVYWDGTGNLQILPDWTATESCKFVAVLKFHVFAFNISGPGGTFPNRVKWSAATEPGSVPGSWTPAADNDAGDVELADSPDEILCAYPLGDTLYIYKRSSTYSVRYIGGTNVFAFRKVQSSSGAISPRAVCDIGGAHLIVSDGDIILNDGTTRRSIGESRVKDFLFDQLDPNEFLQLFCVYNRSKDEVLIGYPTNGSKYCNQALVYDITRDSFGARSLDQVTHAPIGLVRDTVPANTWINRPEPWAAATGVWAGSQSLGSTDSLMTLKEIEFTQEDVETATELPAIIGRSGLAFGEPERVKFVRRVHVRTRKPFGELFVRVGGQMEANGATTWSDDILITNTDQIVNAFAMGRFIAVEIRSTDAVVWKITGVDIEAEMRGYF